MNSSAERSSNDVAEGSSDCGAGVAAGPPDHSRPLPPRPATVSRSGSSSKRMTAKRSAAEIDVRSVDERSGGGVAGSGSFVQRRLAFSDRECDGGGRTGIARMESSRETSRRWLLAPRVAVLEEDLSRAASRPIAAAAAAAAAVSAAFGTSVSSARQSLSSTSRALSSVPSSSSSLSSALPSTRWDSECGNTMAAPVSSPGRFKAAPALRNGAPAITDGTARLSSVGRSAPRRFRNRASVDGEPGAASTPENSRRALLS